MKIKYKLKPEQERPLKIGDKVRIKSEWLDKLEFISITKREAIGFGTSKIIPNTDDFGGYVTGSTAETLEFMYDLDSVLDLNLGKVIFGCKIYTSQRENWHVPIEALEKIIIKKKPLIKNNIQKPVKTIGRPIKSKVSARVIRVKHK